MKNNHSYIQRMAAWAMALPACVALVLTGCTNEQITDAVEAPQTRTVTFTAVAPEGAGSRALWESEPAASGKLGFAWEPETDNMIDLFWVGANSLPTNATLSDHSGALVTVTGEAPNSFTQVIALFPANTIQVGDGEMYRTLPTELTQVGAGTAHLRDYMYLNGTLAIGEVTEGAATMQLTHGCAVLRFNVKNGGASNVRVTKVEMLAASGKTGVHTRAAITSESANNGGALIYSHPENIAIHVQDVTDATKGHLLAAKSGETIESLSVYAHCFPTNISDGQFLFLVTVTDANGENEKTYITKEPFSVSGITTTSDTDNNQKMFKAGYYYTFNLDIANTTRFDEDYITTTVDGKTTYTVTSYAGLWAWRDAVMNVDRTMKDDDINLTLAKDIIMPAVAEGGTNWIPVGGAYVNSVYQKYKGKIDGAGHTISGLVINSDNLGGNGFIGWIENSSITNLKLANVSVTGSYCPTAALVGEASSTEISGCEVTSGTVTGSSPGGLIGNQNQGSITNCTNRATVTSTYQRAGGIVGEIINTTISGCKNYGNVMLDSEAKNPYVGGIVGEASDSGISTCENHGSVAINNNKGYAGGIAGYASDISIVGCTNYNSYIDGKYPGYVAGYVDENTRSNSSNNQNEYGNNELPEYGYIDNNTSL